MTNPNPSPRALSLSIYSVACQGLDRAPPVRQCCLARAAPSPGLRRSTLESRRRRTDWTRPARIHPSPPPGVAPPALQRGKLPSRSWLGTGSSAAAGSWSRPHAPPSPGIAPSSLESRAVAGAAGIRLASPRPDSAISAAWSRVHPRPWPASRE